MHARINRYGDSYPLLCPILKFSIITCPLHNFTVKKTDPCEMADRKVDTFREMCSVRIEFRDLSLEDMFHTLVEILNRFEALDHSTN
jgi:hypothetical protein